MISFLLSNREYAPCTGSLSIWRTLVVWLNVGDAVWITIFIWRCLWTLNLKHLNNRHFIFKFQNLISSNLEVRGRWNRWTVGSPAPTAVVDGQKVPGSLQCTLYAPLHVQPDTRYTLVRRGSTRLRNLAPIRYVSSTENLMRRTLSEKRGCSKIFCRKYLVRVLHKKTIFLPKSFWPDLITLWSPFHFKAI